ncbi:MAG: penicillin-binding protein 2 [Proteobacteria bacterium]|nr:penicillin-binding protein 2 [Pseudomonadota bacterium]MBU1716175.1 penicillin-binding protein 2 [Pseudomonadota bacterium]
MQRTITRINKIDEAELFLLKKRIDFATYFVIFLIAILIIRLWFLQVHKGFDYGRLSENNRIRVLNIVAPRGNIMDQHGIPIITNRPCFNVIWIREDAPNPEIVIKRLSKILNEDISVLLDRIRASADNPRYMPLRLKEDIDWKTLVFIENNHFNLPGVRIEVLPTREYLHGDLASHLIGYLGEINKEELQESKGGIYQGGDQLGKMGIEKLQEQYLRGEKGRSLLEVDVHGFEQRQIELEDPLPGNDLYLTIDIELQKIAEEAMADKAGAVIAMDVNTGRILAMASSPPLNLQEFIGGISSKSWKSLLDNPLHPLTNKAIQGQYPPASIYKIISALAGLGEEIVTPQTVFYCTGSMPFGNRNYRCWKKNGHGAISLKRALAESCDVYFYQLGQKLNVDTLAKYAASFGLGQKTGIELENEKPGLIPTAAWKLKEYKEPWQEGESLSIIIGQGFDLVTPLQVCQMMTAIANGGIIYRPQLIERIVNIDDMIIKEFTPIADSRALVLPANLQVIRDALISAVNDEHGTGEQAKLEHITVAGKTGTAQVVHLSQNKDLADEEIPYKYRDHAWFSCFAPAEKPEIAVTVLIEHGSHGGSVAGPIAKKILEKYFNIPQAPPNTKQPKG